jgi:hypothetical protein
MMTTWLWLFVPAVVVAGILLWLVRRRRPEVVDIPEAQRRFLQQREHLEAEFFTAAAGSGKPRGLRWKDCEWEKEVAFAREKRTGRLAALVAVTISFEAIEGSDMEGLAAVSNLRYASAVFFFHNGRWQTVGKAVFNLHPAEAIAHFKAQYDRVEAAQ